MRTDVDCVMWCMRILARGGANLASFRHVKVLGLIAMVAACNFQATRVDNQLVDASGGEPAVDAPAPPVDAALPDTPPPTDALFCYGAGLLRVCFNSQPIGNINLPIGGVFNTSGSSCN